ncbi:hypothetical protein LIER_36048 [Lithospermum erythrorhizon]|uniref:Integrase catalytic domain-containing protein n=1 Tax=Lithospermum erythrorhizon TaxID=34254 RepID=A0AAV3P416_LITER
MDGSRNSKLSGAGMLIRGPDGLEMEYALRFNFKATNNEVEYEAMCLNNLPLPFSLIPVAMWEIELGGKLPKAKGSIEYMVVVVDYFSKWVEAAPLKKTNGEEVIHFLWKHVITRFGIPKILVSNNRLQFSSKTLHRFCDKYGIEKQFM